MNATANAIFFATLSQYASGNAAAAPALLEAVAAFFRRVGDGIAVAVSQEETANNFRWLGSQDEQTRIQVIALSGTVRKYHATNGERAEMKNNPARARLQHFEQAIYIYRQMKKKKTAAAVVQNTTNNTRAAYKAITRINYAIIQQMRANKKPWATIADTLNIMDGQQIPHQTLAKLYEEVEAEIAGRASLPREMTHFEGEEVPKETIEAYRAAGYTGIEPPQQTAEEERECS